jgi:hypothetical protein
MSEITTTAGARTFPVAWSEYDVDGDPIDAMRGHAQVTGDRDVIEWLAEHEPTSIRLDGLVLGHVDWDSAQNQGADWWVHCSLGLAKEARS